MTEHCPRGTDDPCYVPWWAKGEYAKKHGTKYVTEEGSVIESGRVVVEGHGRRSDRSPVSKYPETPESASETPRKASEGYQKAPRTLPPTPAAADDLAAELVSTYKTREARVKLCAKYGIDPGILDAPNAGIQSMRLRNALRRAIR
jgi:hypothetical protein